jgi:hypothetical protein
MGEEAWSGIGRTGVEGGEEEGEVERGRFWEGVGEVEEAWCRCSCWLMVSCRVRERLRRDERRLFQWYVRIE